MNKQDVIAFFDRCAPSWDADMIKSDEKIGQILDNAEVDAGMDILATLDMLKGRIGCVHLKDYKIVVNTKLDYFDACSAYECVGYGNMDFKTIVPKMKEAGTEHFLVEHDTACSTPDPMATMEKSIRYIQAEL